VSFTLSADLLPASNDESKKAGTVHTRLHEMMLVTCLPPAATTTTRPAPEVVRPSSQGTVLCANSSRPRCAALHSVRATQPQRTFGVSIQ